MRRMDAFPDKALVSRGSCQVCHRPVRAPRAWFCSRCEKMRKRLELRKKDGKPIASADDRLRAMQESWDHDENAFLCHYTKIRLAETERWPHNAYPVFDHRTPGDARSLVVTSHLVNTMKAHLDESRFRMFV